MLSFQSVQYIFQCSIWILGDIIFVNDKRVNETDLKVVLPSQFLDGLSTRPKTKTESDITEEGLELE